MDKILLFNRWDLSEVKVNDAGLRRYINLRPIIVPKSSGKLNRPSIHKADMCIVERFINKLRVPGHKGKKHKLSSGHVTGSYINVYLAVKESFEIIHNKTKKNPVQVLVEAIENSALLEEVMGYRLGGIIARKSVVTTPQRRLDIALKLIAQDIFQSSFRKRKRLPGIMADELIAISTGDQRNSVIQEKNRIEREAEGAR